MLGYLTGKLYHMFTCFCLPISRDWEVNESCGFASDINGIVYELIRVLSFCKFLKWQKIAKNEK